MAEPHDANGTEDNGYRTRPIDTDRMPPGIPYIVSNEMAERFSFYGMKSVLFVFMTTYLLGADGDPAPLEDAAANAVFHYFVSAVYFFPLLGALLADWVFGKYPVIIALSLVYCLGHAVLAMMDAPVLGAIEPRYALYVGLALIAFGAGGIKPCVSAHVGDQFGRRNAHLLERVFGWFYFSINLGAAISTVLCPWLLHHPDYGPAWAFGVPGVLMFLATAVFWIGRRHYAHVPPDGPRVTRELKTRDGRVAVLRLLPLFVFVTAFWALFDQTGSKWIEQAKQMDGTVSVPLYGEATILPSQMAAANPFLVMLLIPVFSYGVYPLVNRFVAVTPLRKIGFGLALAGLAAFQSAMLERWIDGGSERSVSILWQLLPYVTLTSAELLVSITGLEFAYSQAPRTLKSVLVALFYLSVSAANFVVGGLNSWIDSVRKADDADFLSGPAYFDLFGYASLAAAVGFVLWSLTFTYRTVLQSDDVPADDEAAIDAPPQDLPPA